MARIPNIVCAFFLVVGASIAVASDNSTIDFSTYEDGRIERSLISSGIKCASSANVKCLIKGSNIDREPVPCENNMRATKADCNAQNQSILFDVKVKWSFRNMDPDESVNAFQRPLTGITRAKYKKDDITLNESDFIKGEPARIVFLSKTINVCNEDGATMSIKYEARAYDIDDNLINDDTYCFAFKFLRVRTELLYDNDSNNGLTTEISCKMRGGLNDKEDCAGNIFCAGASTEVDVTLAFQYCNWNFNEDLVFDTDIELSFIKIRQDNLLAMSRSTLSTTEKCRVFENDTTINTCAEGVIAELQVTGMLGPSAVVSNSEYTLISVVPCDYEFIITEVVTNEKESFIEVYSPNCKNTIITQDFKLRLYSENKPKPKANDSTNMKGKRTDVNGYITFCRSNQSTVYTTGKCNYVTGNNSPADTIPGDKIDIALFENPNPVLIVDTFGVPGGGDGPLTTVPHRGVRKIDLTNQENLWKPDMWIILDDGISDPGQWLDVSSQSPTTSPPPSPPTTSPPTTSPPTTSPPTTSPPTISPPTTLPRTSPPTTSPPTTSPPTTSPPTTSPPTTSPPTTSPPTTSPPTTSPPTTSPPGTSPPTTSPPTTSPPTTSPPTTSLPTITPPTTSPPTPQPCEYNPLITEIVQSMNILVYIEVMATAACAKGRTINRPLKLVVRTTVNTYVNVDLQGKQFNSDGYLLICGDGIYIVPNFLTSLCTAKTGLPFFNTIPRVDLKEESTDEDNVIDTFGKTTSNCNEPDPTNICLYPIGDTCPTCTGRTSRKPSITTPKYIFDRNQWIFGKDISTMTPGMPDTTDPPTLGPSTNPTTSCNYDVFITEIVQRNREIVYVEVKATEVCAHGRVINPRLSLKYMSSDNHHRVIPLSGSFDAHGFLMICGNGWNADTDTYTCDMTIQNHGNIHDAKQKVTITETVSGVVSEVDTHGFYDNCLDICLTGVKRVGRKHKDYRGVAPIATFDRNDWIYDDITYITPRELEPRPRVTGLPSRGPTRGPSSRPSLRPSLRPSPGPSACSGKGCGKGGKGHY